MDDDLAPARGAANGCLIAILLWVLIALIVIWACRNILSL